MEIKIRDLSWYKRREPTKEIKPISVELKDLELKQNHYCTMLALYDDGNTYELSTRVNQCDITGKWSAQGLNPHGLSVIVDITPPVPS